MRAALLAAALLAACGQPASTPDAASPSSGGSPASAPASAPASTADLANAVISFKGKAAPRQPDAAVRPGPEGPQTVRSTAARIYLDNLASRGKALVERHAQKPDDVATRISLATWHQEQSALDGDLDHAIQAIALLDGALKLHPGDAKLLRLRAGRYAYLHRFAEARADLDAVLAKNPDDAGARRALGSVLRNQGDWEAAAPYQATPAGRTKGFQEYADEAIRAFQAGRVDEADGLLRLAAGAYRDVHPGAIGWIDLQRGLLRLRTGRYPEAKVFFQSAYDRLPQSFVVAEHLAEVEGLLGNYADSLRIYDEVVASTGLPEFMAARAGALEALGRKADAEAALTAADARWKALLEKYPTALAAHAISFWLEDKPDAALALRWAEANLKVRRDPDSWVLAARARAAAGDKDGAHAAIEAARKYPIRVDEFFAGIADAHHRLGEAEAAAAALAEARALNPKTPDP
ncbi:MAG: tetratricopeptide repeat protein [Myxococcales bacterium]|nr:tetratricopeptide repeat protein [Myxococcales bacterium]